MCYTGQCAYEDYFGDCTHRGPCIHRDWWEIDGDENEEHNDDDECENS